MTKLYLAIPCYNEEEVLKNTAEVLLKKYNQLISDNLISNDSKICFIDDGSKDNTWNIIKDLCSNNNFFCGIKLSCNKGHQNALLSGLITLKDYSDAIISIDADLQDDIDAIDKMLNSYNNGADVVYGVRSKRKSDTFFKRFTAEGYYKILNKLGAKIIFNHADFRLMSKKALDAFAEFKEVNIFLRGIVPMIGYKSEIVKYERLERTKGESKYTLKKMLSLAWEGITSLSIRPIRFILGLGIISLLISLCIFVYTIVSLLSGVAVAGWTSLMLSIWALGGFQLLAMGILGEYIGKIYLESKRRPRFIIEEFINNETV